MKKPNTPTLILLGTIAAFVAAIVAFTYIPFHEIQNLLEESSYSSLSQSIFLIYFRIFIFITTLSLIVFLYRNSIKLKKEIILREKIEKESLEKGSKLEEALALSRATLEATADGILVVDKDRRIVGHNEKGAKMWKTPSKVLRPGNDEEAIQYVMKQVKDPAKFVADLERLYNAEPGKESKDEIEFKDGRLFERYTMPQMRGNEVIGRVFSFRDITHQREMEEQLVFQATHDTLTSLPNRVILQDRIQQELRYTKRTNKLAALLFFDLDGFKLINDSLGHNFGDILLQSVARRLEACVREQDTVARWGGDEFVILLTALTHEKDAIPIIKKCLEVVAEPFVLDKHSVTITSSAGISLIPKDGASSSVLLKNADSAMYDAKASGYNNYKFYSSDMNRNIEVKLSLINDLHEALEAQQFFLHYQPLVNLQTGVVVGAEALLRWQHPLRGLISPQEFIPLTEETGLIIAIGEWVLKTACQQVKDWEKEGISPIHMSINLSGQQFRQRNITETVDSIIQETAITPELVNLELTESVIMENSQIYLNYMLELKELGVRLVIDDFGTGYSSLSYLKRFPVDKLKIDQSFVAGLPKDGDDAAIVRAILAMSKQLNLEVVAEGIETKEQLAFLQKHGCNVGQGYLFSKPVPPENFLELLKKNNFKSLLQIKQEKTTQKNPTQDQPTAHL